LKGVQAVEGVHRVRAGESRAGGEARDGVRTRDGGEPYRRVRRNVRQRLYARLRGARAPGRLSAAGKRQSGRSNSNAGRSSVRLGRQRNRTRIGRIGRIYADLSLTTS